MRHADTWVRTDWTAPWVAKSANSSCKSANLCVFSSMKLWHLAYGSLMLMQLSVNRGWHLMTCRPAKLRAGDAKEGARGVCLGRVKQA